MQQKLMKVYEKELKNEAKKQKEVRAQIIIFIYKFYLFGNYNNLCNLSRMQQNLHINSLDLSTGWLYLTII